MPRKRLRPLAEIDPTQVALDYLAGETLASIAERLGCSANVASKALTAAGVQSRRSGPRIRRPEEKRRTDRQIDPAGYHLLFRPLHPHANSLGYVREHRLVMEQHLGRFLSPTEDVHHRDQDKANNHIDNLELTTRSEHIRHHNFERSSARQLHAMSDEEIRRLHDQFSSVQLAREFGTSPASVQRELARRGIRARRGRRHSLPYPPDEELVRKIAELGIRPAAASLGMKWKSLHKHLRLLGLPTTPEAAAAYLGTPPPPTPTSRPTASPDGPES